METGPLRRWAGEEIRPLLRRGCLDGEYLTQNVREGPGGGIWGLQSTIRESSRWGGDVKEDSVGMGRENPKHGNRQLSSFRFMVRDAFVCLAIPESCTRQMRNAAWTDPGARLWAQWGPLLREA